MDLTTTQRLPGVHFTDAPEGGVDETEDFVHRLVLDWTNSDGWADLASWLFHRPLRILIIVAAAWLITRLLRRAVDQLVEVLSAAPTDERVVELRRMSPSLLHADDDRRTRASSRAQTIGSVLRSLTSIIVWTIAVFLILDELSVNLAPLIAGAGIGGIALGFGAQSIVKDFLSGIFMLLEDQYGVGDIIDAGAATGTVERVTLRTTTLRDLRGTMWHIPNGEILRVGNKSQLWSRALIDIEVSYNTDLRQAQAIIQGVADELWQDPEWGDPDLLEAPQVLGVEELGPSSVVIRLVVQTPPSKQFDVERELRLRLKEALDEAGIEIPFPQSVIWHGGETNTDS